MTTEADLIAWAAGLFEGEGCIYFMTSSAGRPILRLSSTDHDVVLRFREVVGCGSIYRRRPSREGWKVSWEWHLGAAADICVVLGAFWPYLGQRRQGKATEALERAVKTGEGPRAPMRYRLGET